MKRLICILLILLLPLSVGAETADTLSDDEITQLLWELYQTENEGEYLVLPEEYELPPQGKTGIYNLLLLGIDNPAEKLTGRSDTMVLASFNARTGNLRLISFMRDTYVSIPGRGHNKLNAAYSYGGAELLKQTLGQSFGVHVDGYVAVNFSLMAELVDQIGGIRINVTQDELKKLNGILEYYNYLRSAPRDEGLLTQAGMVTLNGLQAMSYARIRKLDSDFVRVERQQRVIMAIYDQMLTLNAADLTRIVSAYISRVGTDVTLARAAALAAGLLAYPDIEIKTLRIPAEGAYTRRTLNETYYLIPKLEKCREDISSFLYE
ncbi:MAG: LCP family protein [Clostridia bacterium]|nr:LCP family protein [Clostridia bacterium]